MRALRPSSSRSVRQVIAVAAAAIVAFAVVPALGGAAGAAPGPSATCPAVPPSGSVPVAGYTASTLATGLRYQVNSPGLLPVGDASEGNVTEADVPFARMSVSQGPLVDATASPAYPGDTAAHLGTAIATFGGPAVPNDPILAEAAFPPSPGHGADETFNSGPSSGGIGAGAGTAHSTAGVGGGSATASAASSQVSQPSGAAITTGSSDASTRVDVGTSCVGVAAQSSTGAIDIGGVIKIAGVSGSAAARSDGQQAVPHAELSVGRVTVAGLGASIDRSGIHLNPQQSVGAGVVDQVQALLGRTLSAYQLTIHLVEPTTTATGGRAFATSGGVAITGDRQLPATAVPGVPALSLPGVPPVPIGTPPLPLHVEVVYGAARAAVAATTAGPRPDGGPLPVVSGGDSTTAPPGATVAPLSAGDPQIPNGPVTGSASAPAGSGTTRLVAGPIAARPRGAPVPVGWLIMGILASIAAVGPGLGYARWQLLEGRSSP